MDSSQPPIDFRDALAKLQSDTRTLENYRRARAVRLQRGDIVTALVCLSCAIATLEPATNLWLRSSPVGQFFASVKVEQQQTQKEIKLEPKNSEIKLSDPHPGARLTSGYYPCRNPDKSDCRTHPVSEEVRAHKGIDLSIAIGKPILAAADGTVVYSVSHCVQGKSEEALMCGGGFGNTVEIKHKDGSSTLYAHLHTVTVKEGQEVKVEQQIGTEGSTGNSSGGHLHYEVRDKNNNQLNPLDLYPEGTWEIWR